MAREDYGIAPLVATEGIRFLIPSLCEDCSGRIMVFASAEDLQTLKSYYDELGRASALLFSWTFTRGNVLVQINGDLPEEQAHAYEQALMSIDE
jgi:hypothetical protein